MFPLTIPRLLAAMPKAGDRVVAFAGPLNNALARFDITTPDRVAMFLANAGHESEDLTELRENLNYSADVLRRQWPAHFTAEEAADYARQPERIANRAYANRMGNRDEASGDGWRYRGGGIFQLTGLAAYLEASRALFGDAMVLLNRPEQIVDPDVASLTAAYVWNAKGCNALADAGDFDGVCDAINLGHKTRAAGDAIGYRDRAQRLDVIRGLRPC